MSTDAIRYAPTENTEQKVCLERVRKALETAETEIDSAFSGADLDQHYDEKVAGILRDLSRMLKSLP